MSFLRLAVAVGLATSTLSAQIPTAEYAARREKLLARIDSGVVLAFGRREPINHWPPFYQNPGFRYLTGFLESNAALILVKQGGRVTSTLFVEEPNARTALYLGDRKTPDEVAAALGMKARFISTLTAVADSLAATGLPFHVVSDAQSNEYNATDSLSFGRTFVTRLKARHTALKVTDATRLVDQLRAKKSDAELALIRKAADISSKAHEEAMRTIRAGMKESEIQATMEATYRKLGADGPGYTSIVGAGGNATILHWPASFREAKPGDVVLMDVAAYFDGYSADVTRTVPVDGVYSAEAREVYQIVLDAQKAAERNVTPGTPRNVPNDSAYVVLKAGLTRLGLIESPTASFDAPKGLCPGRWANTDGSCPQWYLYVYHGFMHGIGLDVHDPSQFSDTERGTFENGDAFTIEPGLYVRERVFSDLPDTPRNRALIAHAGTAAKRYRNVGVRIEDDYVLVNGKLERITLVPREINEIEALRRRAVFP
ncbi:MAG: aminopeptidase P N-terminal domain-containing protein [Gemmatimonadaceae bacterium]|nr:aminopeptidase P N-terminal domain-containing protein [Gemmatimonadaceae bacterium]